MFAYGFFSLFLALLFAVVIGSFLNVCIYRMPRGISLWRPARSFCPSCDRTIPWYENFPIVSFLILGGRCSGCGARISVRYWIVELLTGGLFLLIWGRFGWPLAGVYGVLLVVLIVASFIDLEHFIIPDEINWGGMVAGIFLSGVVPEMMGVADRWEAVVRSLMGAGVGLLLLWGVVEFGKLLFGRRRVILDRAELFSVKWDDGYPILNLGDEIQPLKEVFARKSDVLVMECDVVSLNGQAENGKEVRLWRDKIRIGTEELSWSEIHIIEGTVRALTIPREAMGLGDVKFLGAIGAFVGWQGVLFTIFASSVLGSLVGIGIAAKRRLGGQGRTGQECILPFGPFLALGALLWILWNR